MLKIISLSIPLAFPFALVFSASRGESATSQITHFKAGEYQLKKGSLNNCGQGEFKLTDDGANIQMGAHHGVFTATKPTEVIQGDADGDESCAYEFSSKIVNRADEDQITLVDTRTCEGKLSYKQTEVAHFKDGTASLEVVRTGSEKVNYSCLWEKVK